MDDRKLNMKLYNELKLFTQIKLLSERIENKRVVSQTWEHILIQLNPLHIVSIRPVQFLDTNGQPLKVVIVRTTLDDEYWVLDREGKLEDEGKII